MSLDPKAVAHIATLARLAVPETELPTLARELSGILQWIEQLNEVDTSGVEPMTSVVRRTLPRRADLVDDGNIPERVLANAPEAAQGFFVVPKVVE
jgi:aspartyl-tRNA(Asn)/glutamyl-tRNA(Gln) amidotransferase subunit C